MKIRLILHSFRCVLLTALLLSACQPVQPPAQVHDGTEILWDTWGIPHIVVQKDSDAFYAFGWAQMRSHADLLLKLYAVARGRGAEIFGESYLPADRSVRMLGIPGLAEKWYMEQDAAFRANLDAFAAGINDFARQHPETISDMVKAVLPVTPQDVIAHTTRVMTVFIAGTSECSAVLPGFDFFDQPVASNGWALGPTYSASGNAMLLANPHLSWHGLEMFYESHFLLPNVNLYGTALVGSPVLQIAFNDHLGWTHTVNTMDGCDLYQLKRAGATLDDGYLLDGLAQPFNVTIEVIQIRQQDGSMTSESLFIRRSKQGPVIETDDQILAVRFALLETSLLAGMNRQWWEMGHARNLKEFEDVLRGQHLPLFNVIYADADKHIMLAFNGIIPVRTTGDVIFWRAPVPGDDSSLIWSETHSYADLPKSIDPASGWVQNANGAPWYMTMPFLDKSHYSPNIAADVTNNRELRGLQMLNAHKQMSYAELIAAKHSTRALVADQLLDELVAAARGSGDQLLQQAADVLDRWDRQYLAASQGAWLFGIWFEKWLERTIAKAADADTDNNFTYGQLVGGLFYAQPFDPAQPLTTPHGLADVPLALLALHDAAGKLQATEGALDVAWGDIARLRRGKIDLPGNGAGTVLGVFREIVYEPDEDGKLKSFSGDTYIALVEFSQPVRAQVLTTYGNATQNSVFEIGDQLRLAAKQQLRPAWRTLDEIESNVAMREVLVPYSSSSDQI
ncbi:penicillin acylase family protein [Nitrosomonas sp. Nm166]|uniref:penicillin acylase family protein n=1 Tax=Nitrosomonas sp. Nm166 TaxID=1881054 RepID=UPI0008E8DA1B|nr:penicillin acylase family protein [Nitrosomonas sp. Nm166]SFE03381.1 acyl-homoserine-lactone acylase [Nitrosomonas sp. Nm166]